MTASGTIPPIRRSRIDPDNAPAVWGIHDPQETLRLLTPAAVQSRSAQWVGAVCSELCQGSRISHAAKLL
jgi:hypothetical protein